MVKKVEVFLRAERKLYKTSHTFPIGSMLADPGNSGTMASASLHARHLRPKRPFFYFFLLTMFVFMFLLMFSLKFCPKFITSVSCLQKMRRISDLVKMKMCTELWETPRFHLAMHGDWLGRGDRGRTGGGRFIHSVQFPVVRSVPELFEKLLSLLFRLYIQLSIPTKQLL